MTPEGKTKAKVKKLLVARKLIVGDRLYYRMPPANMYGQAGLADFIGMLDGVSFQIETKAGRGKMTALQRKNALEFQAAGGVFFLVDGTEEMYTLLEAFLEDPHDLTFRPVPILPLAEADPL